MKSTRFFSVFLLLALLCSLLSVPAVAAEAEPEVTPIPVMDVAAKAALLVDGDTGEVLYDKNSHDQLYPASITKIMTALLVFEAIDSGKLGLEDEITVTATALTGLATDGSSAGLKQGEVITVHNLLYCMLVVSANEACNILGEKVAGTVSAFVDMMNTRAKAIGCNNTHFANTTGLHDEQHYTSAWDIYLIAREAMKHPMFMTICDTADVIIPATNLSPQRHLYTTNHLLSSFKAIGYRNKEAHGIKTGSTSQAGHCLVSSAKRNDRSLISVVLGADVVKLENGKNQTQSFSETNRLFDWGFKNFSRKTILSSNEMVDEVAVSLSKEVNAVTVHADKDVDALLPNDLLPDMLERTVTWTQETVEAPVTAGQKLGEITLSYDGQEYGKADLIAFDDVTASKLLVFQHNLALFFAKTWVKVTLGVIAGLALLLVIATVVVSRRRARYGRRTGGRSRHYRGRSR